MEYSDEYPYGKEVATDSICISEKNTYNDESRFGMINSMMICRKIGREDAAREMMQSYQLCKEAGRNIQITINYCRKHRNIFEIQKQGRNESWQKK